jgi:RNA polymerase sigma-70 factor (ECF subfamily)
MVRGNPMVMAKAVDFGSFEELALPHAGDLFRAAKAMLGNTADAEDVVQELYLQAWKAYDRFTPGTNCKAWLFGILFNVVRHYRRKWFKFKAAGNSDEILEQVLVYESSIPQELRDEEVLAAVRAIPPQYSEVVLLSDVYEFSYREIQEALGIPAGTVMSRLSRGRRLLRKQLAGVAVACGIRCAAQSA